MSRKILCKLKWCVSKSIILLKRTQQKTVLCPYKIVIWTRSSMHEKNVSSSFSSARFSGGLNCWYCSLIPVECVLKDWVFLFRVEFVCAVCEVAHFLKSVKSSHQLFRWYSEIDVISICGYSCYFQFWF